MGFGLSIRPAKCEEALSIVFAITKKPKIRGEEGQIFKCSLHTSNLELKDELILFGKPLSCRVRQSGHLLNLIKKCARYIGLKIRCLHASCVKFEMSRYR